MPCDLQAPPPAGRPGGRRRHDQPPGETGETAVRGELALELTTHNTQQHVMLTP